MLYRQPAGKRRIIYMNWLLIAVIAIIAVNALIGIKAGFIKTVFSLCSLIVAIILTVWISPVVNNFMKGNEKIYNAISDKVEKVLPFSEEETDANEQVSLIEGLHLPQSIKDSLIENNNAEIYKEMAIDNFRGYVGSYLTGVVINALSFIVTFIVILILLWVICIALDIISKLPLLNQINKLAGFLAGLVHGLVVIWLFFILLTVFQSTALGQKAMDMIGESMILSLIYNNNFLLQFITNVTKMLL
jgi:uncharacterized membrane protein required for colicin V production